MTDMMVIRKHLPLLVGEYHAQRSAHDTPGRYTWSMDSTRAARVGWWWLVEFVVAGGSRAELSTAWDGRLDG